MRAAPPRIRLVALVLAVGATFVGLPSTPRAQVAALNGKQRLLAGERLPVNLAAEAQLRRAAAAAAPRARYVPGRLLIKLVEGVDAPLNALAVHGGARSVSRPAYADFAVITIDPDRDVVAAAAELAAQPGVVYAEPDPVIYPTYVPNDPFYSLQWNLQKIGMERTWDINRGADATVVVAVVDTGVAYVDEGPTRQAPDLAGTNFVTPHDFIWDDDTPVDLDGHGTHVTGTIGQRTGNSVGVAGIAFNVSIMPVKVISGFWDEVLGAPNVGSATTLAEGIRYAADNGAKVINLSVGTDDSTAVKDAIKYAVSKGAVLVAAAGNSGDMGNEPVYPAAYGTEIQGLIAVAALDYNFARAYYSNSGSYVEVAAPGGDLNVDLNSDGYADGIVQQTLDSELVAQGVFDQFSYKFLQGTSMAAPHVSGLAALLVKQGVTRPEAIEAVIEGTATDIGAPGRDNDTGFGVINPSATIFGTGLAK